MQLLWTENDYAGRLNHEDLLVRLWALQNLANLYPESCPQEVENLLDNPSDEMIPSLMRLLGSSKAVQYAPKIMDLIRTEYDLNQETGIDALIEMGAKDVAADLVRLWRSGSEYDGVMRESVEDYLAGTGTEECRQALKDLYKESPLYEKIDVGMKLLKFGRPEDVAEVLDPYLEQGGAKSPLHVLKDLVLSVDGNLYLEWLRNFRAPQLRKEFPGVMEYLSRMAPWVEDSRGFLEKAAVHLKHKQYRNYAAVLAEEAENLVAERYSGEEISAEMEEIHGMDRVAAAILRHFASHEFWWADPGHQNSIFLDMSRGATACFLTFYARGLIKKALSPGASPQDQTSALEAVEDRMPAALANALVNNGAPQALSEYVDSGPSFRGLKWALTLMLRMKNKMFIPSLMRLMENFGDDEMIRDAAMTVLGRFTIAAQEPLFEAVLKSTWLEPHEKIMLFENAPFAEAFDAAVDNWEKCEGDDEDAEDLAQTLKMIGDERGISFLQDLFHDGFDEIVADGLETLAALHGKDIPEKEELVEIRKSIGGWAGKLVKEAMEGGFYDEEDDDEFFEGDDYRYEDDYVEDDDVDFADDYLDDEPDDPFMGFQDQETYRRETPKVGRNDPCPCGSGKKYKKCCLNK